MLLMVLLRFSETMSYVWQPLTPPPDAKTISEFSEEAETVWKYILNRYSEKKPRPPPGEVLVAICVAFKTDVGLIRF